MPRATPLSPETKEYLRNYLREWRKNNKERDLAHSRGYYSRNTEKVRKRTNARHKIQAELKRANPRTDYPDTVRGRARAEGLRSGFERTLTIQMKKLKVEYLYESTKLEYVLHRKYIPDFYLPNQNIYIEAKGKLTPEDRTKMLAVKKQHPELDIRFVFMRGENKLTSKGRTTYMQWAEKNGFPAADGEIPKEWLI